MCEVNMSFIPHAPKKYIVTGNKHQYITAEFDSAADALFKASELVTEGFATVTIRDTETDDGDSW